MTLIIGRYDGTVTLHSFACELGNGSHTRVAQIVAENLEISFDMISIRPTSTDALANCTETGGSFTSLTAMRLAKKASENLKSRLAPFLSETGSWLESIRNAVAA